MAFILSLINLFGFVLYFVALTTFIDFALVSCFSIDFSMTPFSINTNIFILRLYLNFQRLRIVKA